MFRCPLPVVSQAPKETKHCARELHGRERAAREVEISFTAMHVHIFAQGSKFVFFSTLRSQQKVRLSTVFIKK